MEKILFSAYSMEFGGIETSLQTLLNYLARKYEITLVLEKKQGVFLEKLDKNINIVEYTPSSNKNIIVRKFLNLLNRINFTFKYKNKYSFSASFATYSKVSSFVARTSSKNSALWVHADYMDLFNNNEIEFKKFFKEISFRKFKKIVFVAESAKNSFLKIYPELNEKSIFCNNLINYEQISKKAKEDIIDVKKEDIYTFVNISRHDERQKKISRIIEACRLLRDDKFEFRVILVGDGQDHNLYMKMIEEYKLQNNVIVVGAKDNPYPYLQLSNAFILSSDYEGYPVVFLESLVLNKPIITTNISDAKKDIDEKFGIVTSKSPLDIYRAMKNFIEENYEIENKFLAKEYNEDIINKLEEIIKN